jgi:predicted ferric reductase
MSIKTTPTQDLTDTLPAAVQLQGLLMIILVVVAGVLLAINLMPLWLPGLAFSAAGSEPKVFWFLSRGSAMAAYWILWLAMAMGIIITNKMAQIWPGIPPAYEIHQYTSLLGMGFALFHALILMGDQYIHYNLFQVLVPFASENYRPVMVGVGQLALYVWGVVNLSFYVRKRIGKKAWHWIHFTSYASFLGAMLHGILSGTDSATLWAQVSYWFSGASLLFLTIYRVLIARFPAETKKSRRGDAGLAS